MTRYLDYRAGTEAYKLIRGHGFSPGMVKVFSGPAGGPKWFVSVGFDRALMESGFFRTPGERVLLVGSSAGGWRVLAMACRNPMEAYERLRIAYSRNVFTEEDTRETISEALKRNVESFLTEGEIPSVLNHEVFDVAVHAVRARGPAASDNKLVEGAAIL